LVNFECQAPPAQTQSPPIHNYLATVLGECAFYNGIIGIFMVYQDRSETDLVKLCTHPEISKWFSVISVIIFEVNIVAEQKQA